MRELAVYFNDIEAGIITEQFPGYGYVFRYHGQYLISNNPPVSVTLPKQNKAFKSECLFPFFSNMLPEGANRRIICRNQRIDENDFFGLLGAMADKDFIGAVNIRRINNDGNKEKFLFT